MREDGELKNALIVRTTLGKEDHGIFTAYLELDYGSATQGFGGWPLDEWDETAKKRIGTADGMAYIKTLLETLEVSEWEKLPGTYCRVMTSDGLAKQIGHILKDQWFNPVALFNKMKAAQTKAKE